MEQFMCLTSELYCDAGIGRSSSNEFWLYGSKGSLHLDLDAEKLSIALQEDGKSITMQTCSMTVVCTHRMLKMSSCMAT